MLLTCLGIVSLVMLLYGKVAGYEFVYDDIAIVESPYITKGLTREGIRWVFTHTYESNWLPVTWLSHMFAYQLFGLHPTGHHLINVALHAANSILLLVVAYAMTGHFWPATFVATLFAIHPLHVESVAWVSERKDVLSTFFWLLTMLAYLSYIRRHTARRYLLVATLFGLGLLAKATLVTLPCVLLLLDAWPLRRWQPNAPVSPRPSPRAHGRVAGEPASAGWLVAEKLPLLLLAAGANAATVFAQGRGGAMQTADLVPLGARVENALVSYVAYLGKAIWPANLACFYPHPAIGSTPASSLLPSAIAAALVLVVLSAFVARSMARRPYLAVGWLWYLGTLIPMIGLVQVGQQAMADRYTYVPLVGVSIMVAWTVRDLLTDRPELRRTVAVGTVLLLAGYSAVTWFQVATWRDNETLYRHALRVTNNNYVAHFNLGNTLLRQGKIDEAKANFQQTIEIQPTVVGAHVNLGALLQREGSLQDATKEFEAALRIDPDNAGTHNNLGVVLLAQGRFGEALDHFGRAIAIQPDYPEAHTGLGNALVRQARYREAAVEFATALRLRPNYADPYNGLGVLFAEQGDLPQAAASFERALRVDPNHGAALSGLARVRALGGDHSR